MMLVLDSVWVDLIYNILCFGWRYVGISNLEIVRVQV